MTNHNYYFKGADLEDYNFFYTPDEQKEELAIADVMMKGRERLAIGGFFVRENVILAFIKLRDDVPKKFFLKEIKERFAFSASTIRDTIQKDLPIYAIRDKAVKNSDLFLKRLGFKFAFLSQENEEFYKL